MFFFFNDTATTEIYTLSLHDALPIFPHLHVRPCEPAPPRVQPAGALRLRVAGRGADGERIVPVLLSAVRARQIVEQRSEEHTSELQSQSNLVCRLLLEKKKTTSKTSSRPPPSARAFFAGRRVWGVRTRSSAWSSRRRCACR